MTYPQTRSFDWDAPAYARNSDPPTSHLAAASVDAGALEQRVIGVVQQFGTAGALRTTSSGYSPTSAVTVSPHASDRSFSAAFSNRPVNGGSAVLASPFLASILAFPRLSSS